MYMMLSQLLFIYFIIANEHVFHLKAMRSSHGSVTSAAWSTTCVLMMFYRIALITKDWLWFCFHWPRGGRERLACLYNTLNTYTVQHSLLAFRA